MWGCFNNLKSAEFEIKKLISKMKFYVWIYSSTLGKIIVLSSVPSVPKIQKYPNPKHKNYPKTNRGYENEGNHCHLELEQNLHVHVAMKTYSNNLSIEISFLTCHDVFWQRLKFNSFWCVEFIIYRWKTQRTLYWLKLLNVLAMFELSDHYVTLRKNCSYGNVNLKHSIQGMTQK